MRPTWLVVLALVAAVAGQFDPWKRTTPPVSGAWEDPSNWDSLSVPSSGAVVQLQTAGGSFTVTLSSNPVASGISGLTIGFLSGAYTQTLRIKSGGYLLVTGDLVVNPTGVLIIEAGGTLHNGGSTGRIQGRLEMQGGILLGSGSGVDARTLIMPLGVLLINHTTTAAIFSRSVVMQNQSRGTWIAGDMLLGTNGVSVGAFGMDAGSQLTISGRSRLVSYSTANTAEGWTINGALSVALDSGSFFNVSVPQRTGSNATIAVSSGITTQWKAGGTFGATTMTLATGSTLQLSGGTFAAPAMYTTSVPAGGWFLVTGAGPLFTIDPTVRLVTGSGNARVDLPTVFNGEIGGGGYIRFTSSFNWLATSLTGTGTVSLAGTVTFGAGAKTIDAHTLEFATPLPTTWPANLTVPLSTGGRVSVAAGSNLTLSPGAHFVRGSNCDLPTRCEVSSSGNLIIAGTAAVPVNIEGALSTTLGGYAELRSATVSVGRGGSMSGRFYVSAGTVATFMGGTLTTTRNSSIEGPGEVIFALTTAATIGGAYTLSTIQVRTAAVVGITSGDAIPLTLVNVTGDNSGLYLGARATIATLRMTDGAVRVGPALGLASTVTGAFVWQSGTVYGAGNLTIAAGVVAAATTSALKGIDQSRLIVAGQLQWAAGTCGNLTAGAPEVLVANGAVLQNAAGGRLVMTCPLVVSAGVGPIGTIQNDAVWTITGVTVRIDVAVQQSTPGSVNATLATVSWRGGSAVVGSVLVGASSTLYLAGASTHWVHGSTTGTGVVWAAEEAPVTIGGVYSLNFIGARDTSSLTFGPLAPISIASMTVQDEATFTLADVTSAHTVNCLGGLLTGASLTVDTRFVWAGCDIGATFNNTFLRFTAPCIAEAGGNITLDSRALMIDGRLTFVKDSQLLVGGAASIATAGTLSASAMAVVNSSAAEGEAMAPFTATGTITVTPMGDLTLALPLTCAACHFAPVEGHVRLASAGHVLKAARATGNGTVAVSSDGEVTTDSMSAQCALDNDGRVDVVNGTLTLMGGGAAAGVFAMAPGSVLVFASSLYRTVSGSEVGRGGAGDVMFAAGSTTSFGGLYSLPELRVNTSATVLASADVTVPTITLDHAAARMGGAGNLLASTRFAWITGTVFGAGPSESGEVGAAAGGVAELRGADMKLSDGKTFITLGSLQWTDGGVLQMSNYGGLHIGAGAMVTLGNEVRLAKATADAMGTGLRNSGAFSCAAGCIVRNDAGFTQDGNATTVLVGGGSIDAPEGFTMSGGAWGGDGMLNGSVSNVAASLAMGVPLVGAPGTLHVTGALSLGASGVLWRGVSNATGGAAPVLVDGAVTMGGSVNADFLYGYSPSEGDSYPMISSSSFSGAVSGVEGDAPGYIVPASVKVAEGVASLLFMTPVAQLNLLACPGNCSGNGDCNTSTGICDCYVGFTRDDCSLNSLAIGLGVSLGTVGLSAGAAVGYVLASRATAALLAAARVVPIP